MNLVDAVKKSGVVGAGGAGFPTHIKLDTKADCLIINAAECEPLIETDKYICRTYTKEIVQGIVAIAGHLQAKRAVIALKGKYHEEIRILKEAISLADASVEIFELGTFYPAGDEQVIVQQVCGVTVPERGIPLDIGTVVVNVGTLLTVVQALEGSPVVSKFLSVVGEVKNPVMLKVPVGTPIKDCIEYAVPKISEYAVIVGGPMMGEVLDKVEAIGQRVVTKTTGNLIVLHKSHYLIRRSAVSIERISYQAKSACIQCLMCTDLCPRYLIGHNVRPNIVMRNLWREPHITDNDQYEEIFGSAMNCCDCGICEMFSCPMGLSPRRVNIYIKQQLRARQITVRRNMNPTAREGIDSRKVPTNRLTARLVLSEYLMKNSHEISCHELMPDQVFIPFRQHIGKPAKPIRREGDAVKKGDLLAKADESGLSANIHASIDGLIIRINDTGAAISRKGE